MEIINNEYQNCIDFLSDCAQICFECFNKCLNSDDIEKRAELIKSLVECGKHCQQTIYFITTNSLHAKEMALISAHLARVTADLCEDFTDEHTSMTMQVCLETQKMIIDTFDDRD